MAQHAKKPLYLIDGSGYIFRAYFAIRPLSTRDGTPTHAVLGFAKMLLKLLRKEAPEHVCITFDTKEKNFRHAMYDAYKANRDEPPEDLTPQIPLIHELVEAMRLPPVMIGGFEADDIIATLVRQAKAQQQKVMIVTGDKDLMQLVDQDVTLYDPLKDQYFDHAAVLERFGVVPERVVDVLGLAGDVSDNIPGVPRVGPKSAAKLVQTFGDLEQILAGLKKQQKRKAFEQAVLDHEASARLSKRLATLNDEAPIELNIDKLTYGAPDKERLQAFLKRIEAWGLMRDFGLDPNQIETSRAEADGGAQEVDAPKPAQRTSPERETKKSAGRADTLTGTLDPRRPVKPETYRTIATQQELKEVVALIKKHALVSVDLETTSLVPSQAEIVGISLCTPDETAVYIPVAHQYLGVPAQLRRDDALKTLKPVLEDAAIGKVGQNIKYDMVALLRAGIKLAGIEHDSMLAAYVLDASRPSFGLNALAKDVLGHRCITYDDVTGTGRSRRSFSEVPIDEATRYSGEDADVALRLCQAMVPELTDPKLRHIYHELEMPLLPILGRMEAHGVMVNLRALESLSREFTKRRIELENEAFAEIGAPINLGSPKQLSELFFEKLGFEPVKRTKTGYSTDQEVLEVLAARHKLPRIILNHRNLTKLQGTYVDALPRMVDADTHRVHTSFNQAGTATGRLSSSDPNLQNIPIRTEDGRRIRSAFISPKGWQIVSADYSQIELRVMAHLSKDEHFVAAFKNREDIHRRTASEILANGGEPTPEMRRSAKAINFGILYGLSEFGLARNLGIPRQAARDYIKAYFARYPSIRGFLDDTIEEARERGYVETLLGRRRPLPNLRSKNGALRQGAERIAMNTPIQGSAADLIKLAMLRVDEELRRSQARSRLLLQVHDELVLEAPTDEVASLTELLRRTMGEVLELRVPLEVDVGHADNWAEAH